MKKFARLFLSSMLKTSLFVAALTAAMLAAFGSPDNVKQAVNDSGLYDNIVTSAVNGAEQEAAETGQGEGLSRAELQTAINKALPPDTLRDTVEQFLDGTFRWLNGEAATPDFHIDLTDAKQRFVDTVGNMAEQRARELPVCTPQQLRTISPDVDIFSAPCRPPQLSPAAVRKDTMAELAANDGFLKDPVITSETFTNDQGQNVFKQADGARQAFQWAKRLPWLLLGLSALFGAGVILLSESTRRGVRSLGFSLAGTGILVLLGGWLISFLFNKAAQPNGLLGGAAENEFQSSILSIARNLNNAFGDTLLIYAVAYLVIGLGALIVIRFLWKPPQADAAGAREAGRAENDSQTDTIESSPATQPDEQSFAQKNSSKNES